jgi:DNA-directed RNA polymerase specialized sigma24 family protein
MSNPAPFENKIDHDSVADGLSQAQIAEALGVSPRQAKRIEDRAMRKIAELLRQLNITQEDLRT